MRSFQEWRAWQVWGTADGKDILVKDITNGHLINILNWMADREKLYNATVRDLMVQEAQYRRLISFCAKEGLPTQDETGRWWLADAETGKLYIEPPPKEYAAEVKKKQDEWKEIMETLRKEREENAV